MDGMTGLPFTARVQEGSPGAFYFS